MANISIPLLFDREVVRQLLENNENLLELFPSEEEPINREEIRAMQELIEQEAPAAQGPLAASANSEPGNSNTSVSENTGGRVVLQVQHPVVLVQSRVNSETFEFLPAARILNGSTDSIPQAVISNPIQNSALQTTEPVDAFTPLLQTESVTINRYFAKMNVLEEQRFDFDSVGTGLISFGTAFEDISLYGLNARNGERFIAVADSAGNDISAVLQTPWSSGNLANTNPDLIALIPSDSSDYNAVEANSPAGYMYFLFSDAINSFALDVFALTANNTNTMSLTIYGSAGGPVSIPFTQFTDVSSDYYDHTVVWGADSANRLPSINIADLGIGNVTLVAMTVASAVGVDNISFSMYSEQYQSTIYRGNVLANDILQNGNEITALQLVAGTNAQANLYVSEHPTLNAIALDNIIQIPLSGLTLIPTLLDGKLNISPTGDYTYTAGMTGQDSIQYIISTNTSAQTSQIDFTINSYEPGAVDDLFLIDSSGIFIDNVFANDDVSVSAIIISADGQNVVNNGAYTYWTTESGEVWMNNAGNVAYRASSTATGYSDTFSIQISDNGTVLSSDVTIDVAPSGTSFTALNSAAELSTTGQTDWVQLKATDANTKFTIDMSNNHIEKILINDLIDYDNNQLKFINNTDINTDSIIDINDVISNISQTEPNGLMTIDLTNSSTLYLQNAGTLAGLTPEDFLQHLTDLSIQVDIL